MQKKLFITLALASFLISSAAWAAKPSFKCGKKDAHEVEVLICQNDELANLDVSLDSLYNALLKNTPAAKKKALKAEQRGWAKGRNDCWKADDKVACTREAYQTRINELKDR